MKTSIIIKNLFFSQDDSQIKMEEKSFVTQSKILASHYSKRTITRTPSTVLPLDVGGNVGGGLGVVPGNETNNSVTIITPTVLF